MIKIPSNQSIFNISPEIQVHDIQIKSKRFKSSPGAIFSFTPPISYSVPPGLTITTQYSGEPFLEDLVYHKGFAFSIDSYELYEKQFLNEESKSQKFNKSSFQPALKFKLKYLIVNDVIVRNAQPIRSIYFILFKNISYNNLCVLIHTFWFSFLINRKTQEIVTLFLCFFMTHNVTSIVWESRSCRKEISISFLFSINIWWFQNSSVGLHTYK